MNELTTTSQTSLAWNEADVRAMKDQIAPEATESELKLFLYTASQRGLNPLLKQIYCIHRNSKEKQGEKEVWVKKMAIQTSIDGYRLIASRTGKLSGIKRGVKYNTHGVLTHGWAEIYRKGWEQPVYEEVSFKEYTTHQGNWTKIPETMIKKVAEAAALRMAFPEDLSGLYTSDEMDQADRNQPIEPAFVEKTSEDLKKTLTNEKKEAKACMDHINKIIQDAGMPDDEVQWATGLETFKGADLKMLEAALVNLIEHVEAKQLAFTSGTQKDEGLPALL